LTVLDPLELPVSAAPTPRAIPSGRTRVDRVYRGIAKGGSLLTAVVLFLIGLLLLLQGLPAYHRMGLSFLTVQLWDPQAGRIGVAAALYWTVIIALIALVLATPIAVSTALFITEYAPEFLRRPLRSLVDLLAAIPSIIYGLWGLFVLEPHVEGVSHWMARHLAFVPIFKSNSPSFSASAFIAGIVVGIMIMPIIASISREVFSLTPVAEREGALALGATRWDVIRSVVLPFGRAGVIGATLLGLGRALGETIAIYFIIDFVFTINPHLLQAGANSVAALIVSRFGSGGALGGAGLLLAGFVLFVMTMLVNFAASIVVNRSRSARGVEL
jgi:phosphate transport system permease protein